MKPQFALKTLTVALLGLSLLPFTAATAETKGAAKGAPAKAKAKASSNSWKQGGEMDQDFPLTAACIGAKGLDANKAYKGLAIKLGNDAYVCFDTDLLRMYAGWTGSYLNFVGVAYDGKHGDHPSVAGDLQFSTKRTPGVTDANGTFTDVRPEPFGPVPETVGHWNGFYLQGNDVVLSYNAGETKILETPTSVAEGGQVAIARDFKIEKNKAGFSLVLCDVDGGTAVLDPKTQRATFDLGDRELVVALVGAPKAYSLELLDGSRLVLKAAKGASAATFRVLLWNGPKSEDGKLSSLLAHKADPINEQAVGPDRWPEPVVTKGKLETSKSPDGSYVVDQLTPPIENPWKRRVRLGGFDFFADGKSAAFCTWDGDVWIVSGIDSTLANLSWKRFASGGYETLGLKIVNGEIYTSGRNQITRYHDFNQDGAADFYENFNDEITSSDGFHEFVFDLQTDPDGNFYFSKAGPVRGGGRGFGGDNYGSITAHAGTMMRVTPDGKKLEVIATGFRAPNGIGVGPKGELTSGDNEGTWVPTCPLFMVEPGGFYGVETLAHRDPIPEFTQPLCWMSHKDVDNSNGSQVWVTTAQWGPYRDQLLHLSYGQCAVYHVLKEKLYGHWQGGVVKIPVEFSSSCMRAHFNPTDGQLYVCGFQGWQTKAVKITGFDRVRYTGKPVHAVRELQVRRGQIRLTFTQPLDPELANDVGSFSVKRWNYDRSGNYGSPEVSVADPKKQGRDDVEVKKAWLSPDGYTVNLEIPDLQPVMQQSIEFDLKAKDGTPLQQYIQHTINIVP